MDGHIIFRDRARLRYALRMAAAAAIVAVGSIPAMAQSNRNDPVVYCRDPVRNVVTRSLAQDCPHEVVTEKEAIAARNEEAERRRRIMFGAKPDEAQPVPPARPAEPVREAPERRDAQPIAPPERAAPQRAAPAAPPPGRTAAEPPPAIAKDSAPASVAETQPSEPAAPPPQPQVSEERMRTIARTLGAVKLITDRMKPGEWREIPNTRLQDVFPKQAGHPGWGIMGPMSVTYAWSGGAYDTNRNVMVITGGGHGDYGGNEVYEFSLASLRWTRATEPSPMQPRAGAEGIFDVADGSQAPVSSHTYDGLIYLPNVDRIFKFGGSYYRVGTSYDPHAYLYDVQTKKWERRARAPQGHIEVFTGYNPASGEALAAVSGGLIAYNPVTDKWRDVWRNDDQSFARVGEYDPVNRRMVELGSRAAPIVYHSVEPPGPRTVAPASGDLDFVKGGAAPGLAYHAPSQRFAVWQGGRDVWTINPRTWAVKAYRNPNGPAPDHTGPYDGRKTTGMYGRWQYVPDLDVFIGYVHSTDNVWFYKLPRDNFVEVAAKDDCGGADLCVGLGHKYPNPSDAARAVKPGQTVHIAAGEYVDCAVWPVSVKIRGYGGRPHIHDKTCGDKAIWIVQGEDTLIENVTLSGGFSTSGNGNAIRLEGDRLVVRDCKIFDNQMGILTAHRPRAVLEVHRCEFYGQKSAAALAHNIYAGKIAKLVVTGTYIHDVFSGHHIKSVAAENEIVANLLVDTEGSEAAMVDLWGCSHSTVSGNIMSKAGITGNLNFITLTKRNEDNGQPMQCPESRHPAATLAYNTAVFTDKDRRWAAFVSNSYGIPYKAANNIIVNTRELEFSNGVTGKGELIANTHLRDPAPDMFVNPRAFDFRLKKPIQPKEIAERPALQYQHPANVAPRNRFTSAGAVEPAL